MVEPQPAPPTSKEVVTKEPEPKAAPPTPAVTKEAELTKGVPALTHEPPSFLGASEHCVEYAHRRQDGRGAHRARRVDEQLLAVTQRLFCGRRTDEAAEREEERSEKGGIANIK